VGHGRQALSAHGKRERAVNNFLQGALRALLRRETAARTWAAVFVWEDQATTTKTHAPAGFAFLISGDVGDSGDGVRQVSFYVPSCLSWLAVLSFPITAITGDSGDFAALCLRPSARDPTPHRTLLQTKAKPQFDRAVDRTVEAFFIVF